MCGREICWNYFDVLMTIQYCIVFVFVFVRVAAMVGVSYALLPCWCVHNTVRELMLNADSSDVTRCYHLNITYNPLRVGSEKVKQSVEFLHPPLLNEPKHQQGIPLEPSLNFAFVRVSRLLIKEQTFKESARKYQGSSEDR